MGQAKCRSAKIGLKAIRGDIFVHFSNFDICWREVADDALTSMAVEYIGIDDHEKFGDSALNSGRIITLLICPDPFYALLCSI